jgi:hypothetical protein
MTGSIKTEHAPAYPSPLWIIALFIALSEVTAGVAAITTDGITRSIFAVFTVTFPLIVLSAFVWLLVRHPANLYGPWQYPERVGVEGYAAALSRQRRTANLVYRHAAGEAVAMAAAQEAGTSPSKQAVSAEKVEQEFDRIIRESSIVVDCSAFRSGEPALFPVTEETTASELLNAIYFELAPAVLPFTYGESWLLTDQDGHRLTDLGTQWARRRNRGRDLRRLEEVGIELGSSLTVLPLDPPA